MSAASSLSRCHHPSRPLARPPVLGADAFSAGTPLAVLQASPRRSPRGYHLRRALCWSCSTGKTTSIGLSLRPRRPFARSPASWRSCAHRSPERLLAGGDEAPEPAVGRTSSAELLTLPRACSRSDHRRRCRRRGSPRLDVRLAMALGLVEVEPGRSADRAVLTEALISFSAAPTTHRPSPSSSNYRPARLRQHAQSHVEIVIAIAAASATSAAGDLRHCEQLGWAGRTRTRIGCDDQPRSCTRSTDVGQGGCTSAPGRNRRTGRICLPHILAQEIIPKNQRGRSDRPTHYLCAYTLTVATRGAPLSPHPQATEAHPHLYGDNDASTALAASRSIFNYQ